MKLKLSYYNMMVIGLIQEMMYSRILSQNEEEREREREFLDVC